MQKRKECRLKIQWFFRLCCEVQIKDKEEEKAMRRGCRKAEKFRLWIRMKRRQ
jgi:hypothetical protein